MKYCDNKIAENVLSFNEHLLQDKKWEELSTPNNNWIVTGKQNFSIF